MLCSWMVCGVPAAGFCVKLYCCVSKSCNIQHKFFHILWYLFIWFCVFVFLCCIVIDVSSFQRNALPIPISRFFEAVPVNVTP
jgi:hypothetical protein